MSETTVVAIGGEPASGKTTIVEHVISETSEVLYNGNNFKWGELVGEFWTEDELLVYGRYDGSKEHEGTDVLSMSANNHTIQFTEMVTSIDRFNYVLFEGDRLWNKNFIETIREHEDIDFHGYVLDVDQQTLEERRVDRDSDHTDGWLAGKKTEYNRWAEEPYTMNVLNNTEEDMKHIVDEVCRSLDLTEGDPHYEPDNSTFAEF